MRYSDVYNKFFSQFTRSDIHKRRSSRDENGAYARKIARSMITSCNPQQIIKRFHVTRHLHTLALTQAVGRHFSSHTRRLIYAEHRLAYLAWVISRLRPLQRRVLDFLWRPNGPMARRSIREGLTAIHCAMVA